MNISIVLMFIKNRLTKLKKEAFFSKLKTKCPSDKKIERTDEIIKKFNNEKGEELSQLYLKTDVLILACVFEKLIKTSVNEFRSNSLYCGSLPGLTGKDLQTLQNKYLVLNLEKIIRGGISSVMSDRYGKSDEIKKILYADANNFKGHSMSQHLPDGGIEMWHGHPDLYRNKIEEISITLDDSDVANFIEVDLRYPDNIKERTKKFSILS